MGTASQPVTSTSTPTKPTAGQIADTILHDVIYGGVLAASIFVKNPASQQKAATIMQAVQQLLPMLDSQLTSL